MIVLGGGVGRPDRVAHPEATAATVALPHEQPAGLDQQLGHYQWPG